MKKWISALRLRTLPLALASIAMGSFLAAAEGEFSFSVFLLASLTTLFLQITSNLSNDYGDAIHGADGEFREGPERAVSSGAISGKAMKVAITVFAILAFISGVMLIIAGTGSIMTAVIFLVLGVVAIMASMTYTAGSNPYGYVGLGDLSVFIFFGILAVMGTYYLQTGYLNMSTLLPAISMGLLTVAVLNVNNVRDIESDKIAGKKSIPVRIGRSNAVAYHWMLLGGAVLAALIYTLFNYNSLLQFLFLVTVPLLIKNGRAVASIEEAMKLDPYLKQLAMTALLFVLTFGIGVLAI